MKKFIYVLWGIVFARFAYADISSRLNVKTEDGTVNRWPYQMRVTNGDLTDNNDGTVSLSVVGGGGGISGQINNGNTYQTPYYSSAGSSNVLSATSNISVFASSVTIPAALTLGNNSISPILNMSLPGNHTSTSIEFIGQSIINGDATLDYYSDPSTFYERLRMTNSCGVTSASVTAVTFTLSVTETGINFICLGEKG